LKAVATVLLIAWAKRSKRPTFHAVTGVPHTVIHGSPTKSVDGRM